MARLPVRGKFFDTMVAHSLIEPEMRHGMDYLSEVYLGYAPVPITKLIGDAKSDQLNMRRCRARIGGGIRGGRCRCHLAVSVQA